MARTAKRPAAALALIATIPALAACAATPAPSPGVSASDGLPTFVWPQPRMRAPSTERPAWLAPLPAEPQRFPAPEYGFRA